jgi:hypothetical protein
MQAHMIMLLLSPLKRIIHPRKIIGRGGLMFHSFIHLASNFKGKQKIITKLVKSSFRPLTQTCLILANFLQYTSLMTSFRLRLCLTWRQMCVPNGATIVLLMLHFKILNPTKNSKFCRIEKIECIIVLFYILSKNLAATTVIVS